MLYSIAAIYKNTVNLSVSELFTCADPEFVASWLPNEEYRHSEYSEFVIVCWDV